MTLRDSRIDLAHVDGTARLQRHLEARIAQSRQQLDTMLLCKRFASRNAHPWDIELRAHAFLTVSSENHSPP